MDASQHSIAWREQKALIRFLVDGSGKVAATNDDEKNFEEDLVQLILHFCKDPDRFRDDLKKFTEARGYELSEDQVTADDARRLRQRYFGILQSEAAEKSDG